MGTESTAWSQTERPWSRSFLRLLASSLWQTCVNIRFADGDENICRLGDRLAFSLLIAAVDIYKRSIISAWNFKPRSGFELISLFSTFQWSKWFRSTIRTALRSMILPSTGHFVLRRHRATSVLLAVVHHTTSILLILRLGCKFLAFTRYHYKTRYSCQRLIMFIGNPDWKVSFAN